MSIKIEYSDLPRVPDEAPLYVVVRPTWDAERVSQLAESLNVRGDVVDAGDWLVVRDGTSTVEVYRATHSLRLTRDEFDTEARGVMQRAHDRERAVAVAERFMDSLGRVDATAEIHSVTELSITLATDGRDDGEQRVAGLQVNYRYDLTGLPLIGPGAKAQVTVDGDGQVQQAYRFWRELQQRGTRPTISPEAAIDRFASREQFADMPDSAQIRMSSVQFGLLSLPPTEVQGVLLPAYVLRGEIDSELLRGNEFIAYVAAVEIDEAEAKRNRWSLVRPSLLAA